MAVADAAVKPSLPLARIVLAPMLALVRFVRAPLLALVRIVRVADRALPYLSYAVVWVFAATLAGKVVAARTWGKGSAPFVFLQELTDAVFALLMCGLCLAYVIAVVSVSGSEFKKGALGLGARKHDSTRVPLTAVLGWVASLPFMLLLFTGSLIEVMSSSPVKGSISKGEMIGSVIVDVGVFGTNAITCFVVIPALVLGIWRDDQSDRQAGLAV